jgi:hypothetical protein
MRKSHLRRIGLAFALTTGIGLSGSAVTSLAGQEAGSRNEAKPDDKKPGDKKPGKKKQLRADLIARSHVWRPVDVTAMNLRTGPDAAAGGFPPFETVECDYVDRKLAGASPKFACRLSSGDEVKVKHGGQNGEVYGEVAATRLLWALGFAADRMYPVRIVCRGCPQTIGGVLRADGTRLVDPAVIERKIGRELLDGWAWQDLDRVDESRGGAPRAHRDALKLLAAFIQHTDSKEINQRVACLDEIPSESGLDCAQPLMMINDAGLTFGRANLFNQNRAGSVNLAAWSKVPVWKGRSGCTANLAGSATGTLKDPAISEEGRQFLADLLTQLTDAQLRDLFEVSRINLRTRAAGDPQSGLATADEWINAFKEKRDQIVNRSCAS